MTSMLEVLREYKHLTAKKKKDGALPPSLEERLAELQELVRANAPQKTPPPRLPEESLVPQPVPAPNPAPNPALSRRHTKPPGAVARTATPTPGGTPKPRVDGARKATTTRKRQDREQSEKSGQSAKKKLRGLELVLAYLPRDQKRRQPILWGGVALFFLLGIGAAITFGLSLDRAVSNLLPSMALIGACGWGGFYPLLMFWREHAARKSDVHLHQPSFEAKAPMVEPVIATLVLMAAVVWLMVSGYTKEGIGPIIGYLVGMAFGLISVAIAAILVVRPIFVKRASDRAFDQYVEAGQYHLGKNNPKRARRMFDKALVAAKSDLEKDQAARLLRDATGKEAEELRQKGLTEQADRLIEAIRQKEGMGLVTGWSAASGEAEAAEDSGVIPAISERDVLAKSAPPRILSHGSVKVEARAAPPSTPDGRAAAQRAKILERKGRAREALEVLLSAGMSATPELAREAAKEYIAQGVLRSADVIYEALGEPQIPEFYKAVAVELAKTNEGHPPGAECLRLVEILARMNELKAAAQIACRGATSDNASGGERQQLGRVALELCQRVGAEPPAELLESIGQLEAAARGFETEGRPEDAKRCYMKLADKLLANAGPKQYVPVLSKLFLMEDKGLEDKYLQPLANQVANSNVTNATGIKILQIYRRRHPGDRKMARRLFEIYATSGRLEEALAELDALQKSPDTSTTNLLVDYQMLVDKYPKSFEARARLIHALLRVGKVTDAVRHVHELMKLESAAEQPERLIAVLDALFEWGHADPELRKEAALLKLSTGDREGALDILETYVLDGGRDPEAIEHVEAALRNSLVLPQGGPNHEAHMRLARFMLHRGAPEHAIPLLEVGRSSGTFAFEAEVLLARAHLAASNPRSAIDYLRDAISGRGLSETPELHFELARAYEELGQLKQAQKIDDALDMAMPGFRKEYVADRLVFERADTEWIPPVEYEEGARPPTVAGGEVEAPTDVEEEDTGVDPAVPQVVTVEPAKSEEMALEEVLAPRYKLRKRVGSGGMGDVHLAEDLVLGRSVAIKVLRRNLATDLFLAKFRDEARIVAQLVHPGIVQVYDIGQRADWAYIVMEYVAGPNLATLVCAASPPTRPQVLNVMADVAEAMGYAHKRGVIHRDLKPANILVATDGVAKVTDFGIAHVLQGEGEETAFSAAGMQVGTVNYMAPEQIRGSKIDARTDIYLLGTTLYYCLAGKYPFSGDAVVLQKLENDPTPIERHAKDVTPDLAKLVMRCIAREPEHRPQTMEEVAQRIRRLPDALADQRTELL